MSKLKIYKIILWVLIIAIVIISILIIKKYMDIYKTEQVAKQTIEEIKIQVKEQELTEEIDTEVGGYKVVGIITIPKINVEYPILAETNNESLSLSVTKFWGNKINEIGNVTIAGHNNLNGAKFGKIDKLQKGDIIELTDIQNITIKYEVFDTYTIDPNDISCILQIQEGTREVTLITCKNGKSNRFIVKAREID